MIAYGRFWCHKKVCVSLAQSTCIGGSYGQAHTISLDYNTRITIVETHSALPTAETASYAGRLYILQHPAGVFATDASGNSSAGSHPPLLFYILRR